MNYFLYALKNSFNIKGRARRAEFGWFTLICMLISFSLMLIGGFAEGLGFSKLASAFEIINSLFSLLIFPASITIAIRRLHDLGLSGWWQLVIILPTIGISLFMMMTQMEIGRKGEPIYLSLIALCVIFACVIFGVLFFKEGKIGENQYGEDPKAKERALVNSSAEHSVEKNNENS